MVFGDSNPDSSSGRSNHLERPGYPSKCRDNTFFINTANNAYLDWFSPGQSKHPVFGKVTEGMDVVKAIGSAKTGAQDRPQTPIQVTKITIEE